MEDFKININDITYQIKFENQKTMFKPLNLSISRVHHDVITILEKKKYNKIRRRIYNNIINVDKLKDGKIRNYQVFNTIELETLAQYLSNKNILFRILNRIRDEPCFLDDDYSDENKVCDRQKTNVQVYKTYDKSCFFDVGYPDENKVSRHRKVYVRAYKGYTDLTEYSTRRKAYIKAYADPAENLPFIKWTKPKYGIYL